MIDYRKMLVRYMAGVIACEGVSFAKYYSWPDAEQAELDTIEQEANAYRVAEEGK